MFLLLLACNGKDAGNNNTDATTADSGDSGPVEGQSPFTVETQPSADMECWNGEVSTSPEPTVNGSAELAVSISFQGSDEPIADQQIVITGNGEEPLTIDADEDGSAGDRSIKVCTPLSAVAGPKPGAEGPQDTVSTASAKMASPSDTQWRVPVMTKSQFDSTSQQLGVEQRQQGTGIINGSIKACGGSGLDHVQLSLEQNDGQVTWGYIGDDGWGSGEWTNETGAFAAANVPAGPSTVTAWVWNGEKHVAVARAEISVPADGVRTLQLSLGKAGELNVPEDCFDDDGGGGQDTGAPE